MKYAFIYDHARSFSVRMLCRLLSVHPSGYYAWRHRPTSTRAQDNRRLLERIRHFWHRSGKIYGYRKVYYDLRDIGESCSPNRVWRLMKQAGIRAEVGYRKPGHRPGKASVVSPNRLAQDFQAAKPNQHWVSDITYVRTHEGWLYLAVVIDLYSRRVVGWSMRPSMSTAVVLNALLMALWRRKPTQACDCAFRPR